MENCSEVSGVADRPGVYKIPMVRMLLNVTDEILNVRV